MSETKQPSFIKGAAILAGAGLIVRIIGAFYRIPLANLIGDEGVGLYTLTYPFYNFLLIFSTSGIPSGIAKMVSEALVNDDKAQAHRIFSVSMKMLILVGLATALLMGFGSGAIALAMHDPLTQPSIIALAPALFMVAALSVFRGYFQGMQNMKPTALSQILEQAFKLTVSLYLAYRLSAYGVEYGAAGALLGVSISEVAALALVYIFYRKAGLHKQAKLLRQEDASTSKAEVRKANTAIRKKLLQLAIPIMLASSVMALSSMIDSLLLPNLIQRNGYVLKEARSQIGLLGMANNLVNVTSVLSMALSMSLVPSIADSGKRNDWDAVRTKVSSGIKLAIALVMPACAGLMILAQPVLTFLYGRTITAAQMPLSVALLQIAAPAALLLSVVQTSSGILQGMGKVNVPLISLGIGAAVKVVVNYLLISTPSVGVMGAPVGTICCYLIAASVNTFFVAKHSGTKLSFSKLLLRPLFATAVMSGGVWLVYTGLRRIMGLSSSLLISIFVGIGLYMIFALMLRVITKEELTYLPGGRKITPILQKLKLI